MLELKIFSPQENGFVPEIKWNNEELKVAIAEKMKRNMFEIRMYMSRSMQNIYCMIRMNNLSRSQKQLLIRVVKIWRM